MCWHDLEISSQKFQGLWPAPNIHHKLGKYSRDERPLLIVQSASIIQRCNWTAAASGTNWTWISRISEFQFHPATTLGFTSLRREERKSATEHAHPARVHSLGGWRIFNLALAAWQRGGIRRQTASFVSPGKGRREFSESRLAPPFVAQNSLYPEDIAEALLKECFGELLVSFHVNTLFSSTKSG